MGLFKVLFFLTLGVLLFLGFAPGFLDVRPQSFTKLPEHKFEGPLAPNKKLDALEFLFKDAVDGPESLAYRKGVIYSGTADGKIVQMEEDNIKVIARLGEKCRSKHEVETGKCSQPVGMRLDRTGNFLYFADIHRGLLRVDLKTGETEEYIKKGQVVDGAPVLFLDDLDIDEDEGVIYVSDVSTRWGSEQFPYGILEHENTGRIMKYDIKNRVPSVIANELVFPNGVQLAKDKQSILVAETTAKRIRRIYVKGEKAGTKEVFTNLPFHPDNIRPSKSGGYWASAVFGTSNHHFGAILDLVLGPPVVRKILLRLSYVIGSALEEMNRFYPLPILEEASISLTSGGIFMKLLNGPSTVIELDDKGQILRSFQATRTEVINISEVLEENGYLYLGSFTNPFLGRLKL